MSGERILNITDIISQISSGLINEIHTAIPAIVDSYEAQGPSISARPVIRKVYPDGSILEPPVIYGIPVVYPGSKNTLISFPLEVGDGVLLIFSEKSLDQWLSSGNISTPEDARSFDLTDAIAIPGLFATGKGKSNSNSDSLTISFKNQRIVIDPNGNIALGDSGQFLVTAAYKSYIDTLLIAFTTFVTGLNASTLSAQAAAMATALAAPAPTNGLTSKVKAV